MWERRVGKGNKYYVIIFTILWYEEEIIREKMDKWPDSARPCQVPMGARFSY